MATAAVARLATLLVRYAASTVRHVRSAVKLGRSCRGRGGGVPGCRAETATVRNCQPPTANRSAQLLHVADEDLHGIRLLRFVPVGWVSVAGLLGARLGNPSSSGGSSGVLDEGLAASTIGLGA
ncbi:hypothetical protein PLESTB_000317100 [Pleodorina starrii]|uniref:Uncharacterized protein n=1 Tax=Pleodorina starrii TaxID=330485 RepID=A0A9W6BDN1_9CHLO|nr:hypothetical protein PLESTB_000317100 [Pleodorina starrii]